MALQDELWNAFSAICLSEKAMADIARRKDATKYAIWFLIASGSFIFLLNLFAPKPVVLPEDFALLYMFSAIGFTLFFSILTSCVMHGIALLFKGTGSILGLFRVFGYIAWLNVLQAALAYIDYIPYGALLTQQLTTNFPFSVIEIVFMVYSIVLLTYILRTIENVATWKAVLTWIITSIVFIVLYIVLYIALFIIAAIIAPPIA